MDIYWLFGGIDLSVVLKEMFLCKMYKKISTVWQWHDIGYFLEVVSIVGVMVIVAISLLKSGIFANLKLQPLKNVGFKKFSWQWFIALAALVILPPALYTTGQLPQQKFLGIPVTKLWLLDGNVSAWLCWQWLLSLVLFAFFLVYHFTYGKKNGGDFRSYGFSTSDTKKFDLGYLLKSILFGVTVVGSGYLLMAFASHYTQQGLHIATFMLRTIDANRTFIFFVYFLFSVPYFLSSSLVAKTLGLNGDGTAKTTAKNVGI